MVPIQIKVYEGWEPLVQGKSALDETTMNNILQHHSWKQALRDCLAATLIFFEGSQVVHNHSSNMSDDLDVATQPPGHIQVEAGPFAGPLPCCNNGD